MSVAVVSSSLVYERSMEEFTRYRFRARLGLKFENRTVRGTRFKWCGPPDSDRQWAGVCGSARECKNSTSQPIEGIIWMNRNASGTPWIQRESLNVRRGCRENIKKHPVLFSPSNISKQPFPKRDTFVRVTHQPSNRKRTVNLGRHSESSVYRPSLSSKRPS